MFGRKHVIGKQGEQIAISHLMKMGYTIEAVNYRCPFGEMDIIARDGNILAFIEVKTRFSERYGSPVEAVDSHKQHRLHRIALYYLTGSDKKGEQEMCRFDVVSVFKDPHAGWEVELIKDAFPLS